MRVDSWLTEEDAERCWKVVHGELPESFATAEEIDELSRVIEEMVKHPDFKRNQMAMN